MVWMRSAVIAAEVYALFDAPWWVSYYGSRARMA
jgi:hypothetical protein